MMPSCEIRCGECSDVLSRLNVKCNLIVTSPPYDNLRTYDGYEFDFKRVAQACYSALIDGGVLCWNVGDQVVNGSETLTSFRQALHFVDEVGFRMHDTMIWHKRNFSSPSFNRYHQCFEYIFVLAKGQPRCFNPIKDKPNATAGNIGNLGVNTYSNADGSRSEREKNVNSQFGMRHNVWNGLTRGQEDMCEELPHPAMMPKWLARDLILSWSNHGDLVVDPMCGSGTVGRMAIENGRCFLGIDSNTDYCKVAQEQCAVTPSFQLA